MGFGIESKVLKLQKQMRFLKKQYDCIREKGCACVNEGYSITQLVCVTNTVTKYYYAGTSEIGSGDCFDAPYGIFSSDTSNTTPLVSNLNCNNGEMDLARQIVEGLISIGETQARIEDFYNGGDGVNLGYRGLIDFSKYRLSSLSNLRTNYFSPYVITRQSEEIEEVSKFYKITNYIKENEIKNILFLNENLEIVPEPRGYKICSNNPDLDSVLNKGNISDKDIILETQYTKRIVSNFQDTFSLVGGKNNNLILRPSSDIDTLPENQTRVLLYPYKSGTLATLSDIQSASGEMNVQSDWSQNNSASDDFIKNKPILAPSNAEPNVQSNWNESNSSSDAFILNKPSIPNILHFRMSPPSGTGYIKIKLPSGMFNSYITGKIYMRLNNGIIKQEMNLYGYHYRETEWRYTNADVKNIQNGNLPIRLGTDPDKRPVIYIGNGTQSFQYGKDIWITLTEFISQMKNLQNWEISIVSSLGQVDYTF